MRSITERLTVQAERGAGSIQVGRVCDRGRPHRDAPTGLSGHVDIVRADDRPHHLPAQAQGGRHDEIDEP